MLSRYPRASASRAKLSPQSHQPGTPCRPEVTLSDESPGTCVVVWKRLKLILGRKLPGAWGARQIPSGRRGALMLAPSIQAGDGVSVPPDQPTTVCVGGRWRRSQGGRPPWAVPLVRAPISSYPPRLWATPWFSSASTSQVRPQNLKKGAEIESQTRALTSACVWTDM